MIGRAGAFAIADRANVVVVVVWTVLYGVYGMGMSRRH